MLAVLAPSVQAQEGEIGFKATELVPGLYMLEGDGGFAGGNPNLMDGEFPGTAPITPTPEPGTGVLVMAGLAVFAHRRRAARR